ncbi:MAG: LacI family DNA-binding transcriptional regulator [Paracoccaceae bacterium]
MSGEGIRGKTRRRVTVKDLARDLGMSVSTVSRAFYPDAIVAPETRRLVLQRAEELGYRPNPLAQSLITNRTQIVGLVVSGITNPFYPEVMTRLTTALQGIGMNVMLVSATAPDRIDEAVTQALTYSPDLIVILAATMSSRAVAECTAAGTACIFFNRLSSDPAGHGVTCDNIVGAQMAADHLIDKGHRRLCYVAAFPDASTNIERWQGFRDRVMERGLPEPQRVEVGNFSYEAGFSGAEGFAALAERPDGVFCANDIVAIGFIEGLRAKLGIAVPRDVSVVGFDNITMAAWPSHALTTIPQPIDRMLEVTVNLARRLGADPSLPTELHRIAPDALIERGTTRGSST